MAAEYDTGPIFESFTPRPGPYGLMQSLPHTFDYSMLGSSPVEIEAAMQYMTTMYYGKEGGKKMQKTFCDLCETEIVNWRVRMHTSVIHTTNQAENVGEDEFKPLDICKRCAATPMTLLELMRTKMRTYMKPEPLMEDTAEDGRAMEAPVWRGTATSSAWVDEVPPSVQIGPDGVVALNNDTD